MATKTDTLTNNLNCAFQRLYQCWQFGDGRVCKPCMDELTEAVQALREQNDDDDRN